MIRIMIFALLLAGCKCTASVTSKPTAAEPPAEAKAEPSASARPCNGCRHGLDPASADRVEQRQMQQITNQLAGDDDD